MSESVNYIRHFKKGLEFYAGGHYDQALTEIKKTIVLQPDFSDAYFHIAKIYDELKRFPEAVSMYEKLLKLLPNDLGIHCSFATTLLKSGQERRGVKMLKRALRLNPNDTRARTELYRHYMRGNKLWRSQRLIQKGLKAIPEHAPFYCMMGDIMRRKNKLEKAQDFYEQCLDLDSDYDPAKRGLNAAIRGMESPPNERRKRTPEDEARSELVEAAGFYKSGNYDQAIERLTDLRDRPGIQREASMLLGLSFVNKGLFKRARDVLHHYVSEHEPDLLALYNLGLSENRMGRYADSFVHLEKALAIDEDYVEALIEMGIACQMSGEIQKARDFFMRALKNDRENARPYANLARLAYDHGDRSKAVQFLKKAKSFDEHCPDVYLVLGYIAIQNERYEESEQHLEACLKQLPDHFEAHKLLGYARMETGNNDEAMFNYQSAMALNPADPECNQVMTQLNSQLTA